MFLIMQISNFPLDDTKIPLKEKKSKKERLFIQKARSLQNNEKTNSMYMLHSRRALSRNYCFFF